MIGLLYQEELKKVIKYISPILKEYGYEYRCLFNKAEIVYTKIYDEKHMASFTIEPTKMVFNEKDQVYNYKYVGFYGIAQYEHFKPTIFTKSRYYQTDITDEMLNELKDALIKSDLTMKQYITELKKYTINKDFIK